MSEKSKVNSLMKERFDKLMLEFNQSNKIFAPEFEKNVIYLIEKLCEWKYQLLGQTLMIEYVNYKNEKKNKIPEVVYEKFRKYNQLSEEITRKFLFMKIYIKMI